MNRRYRRYWQSCERNHGGINYVFHGNMYTVCAVCIHQECMFAAIIIAQMGVLVSNSGFKDIQTMHNRVIYYEHCMMRLPHIITLEDTLLYVALFPRTVMSFILSITWSHLFGNDRPLSEREGTLDAACE